MRKLNVIEINPPVGQCGRRQPLKHDGCLIGRAEAPPPLSSDPKVAKMDRK